MIVYYISYIFSISNSYEYILKQYFELLMRVDIRNEIKLAYLDDVSEAGALVGMEVVVQSLTQPTAQHLDLGSIPLLNGKVWKYTN